MEAVDEFAGSNDHTQIAKGKRTKRQRPPSPFGVSVTSSSSSGGGGGGGGGGGEDYYSAPSPTISGDIFESTEEEEDMANCLILLAQGVGSRQVEDDGKMARFSTRRLAEMAATTTSKAGFYVYECKTCNRTFPSFQALGGHRASHKKPRAVLEEKKSQMATSDNEDEEGKFNKNIGTSLSLQIANKAVNGSNKSKVHECSICGSEFSSGQALGGHMRRHRAPPSTRITTAMETSTTESHDAEEPKHVLPLDLNLPAPEDDHRDSKFQFSSTQQHLVFSTPALVDCHY